MTMGQAVGTAAAVAAEGAGSAREVDRGELLSRLRSTGAILSVDDALLA
jgi:hypothetical protein